MKGLKGFRFNFELHRASGIYSAVILCVLAFTGFTMAFPWIVEPVVATVSERRALPKVTSPAAPMQSGVSADEAVKIAEQTLRGGSATYLELPLAAEDVYRVTVRLPGEVRRSAGRSRVWIDQFTGEVLATHDTRDNSFGDTFFDWIFPLHNGEAFGLAGRWIVLIVGLSPTILLVTGAVVWWKRRGLRRSQARRKQS